MDKENEAGRRPDRLFGTLIGLGYLLVGLVWIGFSDEIGRRLFSSTDAITRFQTYKGSAFITVNALLVGLLVARRTGFAQDAPLGRVGASLSALLAGLVLATATPLVALLGYNMLSQTGTSVAEAKALVQGVAGAAAAQTQSFLEERQRLARVLASRPLVLAVDGSKCDPLLADVAALHDDLRNVAVLDLAGRMVCGSHPGFHLPVGEEQLQSHPAGLLSAPVVAPAGPALALTYPIRSPGGELRGGLQLMVAASWLEHLLAGDAPPGTTALLITDEGHMLARWPAVPGLVGRRMPNVQQYIEVARRGGNSLVARGVDGVERFYAVRPIPASNVIAVAGVDVGQTFGPLRAGALRSLAIAVLVLLAAGLLVSLLVRRISAPVRVLAEVAGAVAGGQLDRRAPEGGPREMAGVALQFNRMLDRLPALERELRDSEERHRTLLQKLSRNIPGMIFQLRMEADGRSFLPFTSDAILPMFEVGPQQARDDAWALLQRVHPDDQALLDVELLASRDGLSYLALEYRVLLPAGGLRHYLTYAQPERVEDGAVLWHGCTVDVTRLKQAEQALRQANEHLEARVAERTRELAAANESLESFSYSVAHDLRAPLAAIEGFSGALPGLIARGEQARVQRLVQRITANTAQMGRMIDGLLAVARAGKSELEEDSVALGPLLQQVVQELQVPAPAQLHVEPLPLVRVDAGSLRQVWWNLLSNALKFSAGRPQPRIDVGWQRSGDELVFRVRDNGAGFDPQFAGRLFTAFQRLHEQHEFEGNGIGLALARRVVERHGGRIWAEGRPGEGATFFFTLPASRLVQA